MWEQVREGGNGVPHFSRWFNDWELEGVEAFLWNLHIISITNNKEDRMNWKETKCSKFSIKFFLSSLAKGEREPFPINIVWNPQYQQK